MADRTDDPYASVFGPPPVVPAAPAGADRPDPYAALGLPPVQTTSATPPDDRPWYVRANEGAGDAIRGFTNAVTLGNMDRIAGGMNYLTGMGGPSNLSDLVKGQHAPQSYDEGVNQQVALSQAAQQRSPYAYLGGNLAGGAAIPGFGAEMLATKLGGGALARLGGYGAAGAGLGAAEGAGNTYSGKLSDYASNALMGGVLGGALGGTMGSVLGPRPRVSAAETPTTPEIYSWADKGYDKLRQNYQDIYEAPHVANRADQAENVAANTSHIYPGFIPALDHGTPLMNCELQAAIRAAIPLPPKSNAPARCSPRSQKARRVLPTAPAVKSSATRLMTFIGTRLRALFAWEPSLTLLRRQQRPTTRGLYGAAPGGPRLSTTSCTTPPSPAITRAAASAIPKRSGAVSAISRNPTAPARCPSLPATATPRRLR